MNIIARTKAFVKVDSKDYLEIEGGELKNQDFSNQNLKDFTAIHSRFKNCIFENMPVAQICFFDGSAPDLGTCKIINTLIQIFKKTKSRA